MKLAELQNEAKKILDIPDNIGEYENVSFVTRSGGSPTNKAGVPEVHRSDDFAYDTTANGAAYRGEVVVLCKDTKAQDANGNPIFITPDGVVFVFEYYAGSPANFDWGCLMPPTMS